MWLKYLILSIVLCEAVGLSSLINIKIEDDENFDNKIFYEDKGEN